eukprot:COSAG01_NODE_416_length_17299_cov_62.219186_11_plen_84_part_00
MAQAQERLPLLCGRRGRYVAAVGSSTQLEPAGPVAATAAAVNQGGEKTASAGARPHHTNVPGRLQGGVTPALVSWWAAGMWIM